MDINLLENAAETVLKKTELSRIKGVLILGSGWSEVADAFEPVREIPYQDIPGLGRTGVAGHAGRLRHCRINGEDILIFQGRRHWYEGEGWTPIALPVYIAARAAAGFALITNAAGGVSENMRPGDLMMITDHINAMGANPLIGPHHKIWGPRFPDQSSVYNEALRLKMLEAASASGVAIKEGVYLATSGPTYETPAEVMAYRLMGADAVGMSTVPEATLANAASIKVAAISCITNPAAGVAAEPLGHTEVIETTHRAMPSMTKLIYEFVALLTAG